LQTPLLADAKAVKAAMKQQPNKGGVFFPITAVQVRAEADSRPNMRAPPLRGMA
jgi:hypothetical protein